MTPAFSRTEYDARLAKVRAEMANRGLDVLVIGDPNNHNWLTGYDAWSFYTPQIVLVQHDVDPIWMGRKMDGGAAKLTTYMTEDQVRPYPEDCVQKDGTHPMAVVGRYLAEMGLDDKVVGYESDTYFLSAKAVASLQAALPNAHWVDADLLVNWCRTVKSDAEVAVMRQAATLAEGAMRVAYETIRPGIRQCDLVAAVVAQQVGGNEGFSGDLTALSPLVLAGEAATTAHPMWTDERFGAGQTVALELGGARKRYNAGLARTVQLGGGSQTLFDTAKAVEEGLEAVLSVMKPGVIAHDVHRAWQDVLDRYGLSKDSRIGYGIGVGYGPDWGEHTVSLRPGDTTVLEQNMTIHVMLGMWMDDWGMEMSETTLVTASGVECLTNFPRGVHVIG
ncbi:MAG: M24 family metallopeptidase [Actinomycetia bacterium]|nr:M24 family metallopeptidase [Actinomycetes bacterium]